MSEILGTATAANNDIQQLFGIGEGFYFLLTLPVGVLFCFFGYRYFRVLVAVIGFLLGAAIGGIGSLLSESPDIAWLVGMFFGIAGAMVAWNLRRFGVWMIGAVVGGFLFGSLGLFVIREIPGLWVGGVLGVVVGGVVALRIDTIIIVLFSAYSGSSLLAPALVYFLQQADIIGRFGDHSGLLILIMIAAFISGVIVQWKYIRSVSDTAEPEPTV